MKYILFLIVSACFARDFGQLNLKGAWVKCSEEEPDCRGVDKLDNVDAVCMERVMKSIGNLRNPDYINAVNSDAWLDSGYLNKKVIRCTTDTDMDYWLDLSGVKDTST